MDYPVQTALVEYHTVPGDFGYFLEARNRIYNYYTFYGYPSLFADGVDLWPISTWRPFINSRVNQPSPFTLLMTGNYSASTNTGTINASYQNDSTAAITARVYFVITEDSLYHLDPNGHAWHNHLARDMLPDQTGELVAINPGQVLDISRNFTIDASWNEDKCYIVTWIQADAPSRNVYQAGEVEVMDLVGIEENTLSRVPQSYITLLNNPCSSDNVRFELNVPQGTSYRIEIFDPIGRKIKQYNGMTSNEKEILSCDLSHLQHNRTSAGVYFYRFTSSIHQANGKVIVR
ncbi:MAG: Omp28-related outer membrane protein [bacterium]